MSVFQHRQANSTHLLMRFFERLGKAVELVCARRTDELKRHQKRLATPPDFSETRTADEDASE